MTRRDLIQRVALFMGTFMPTVGRAQSDRPTFHPLYIEHLSTRVQAFDDDTIHGIKLQALLSNGQVSTAMMVWTDQSVDAAKDVSQLFTDLVQGTVKALQDTIDNGVRRA